MIIIAVIALLVLAVMVFVTFKYSGNTAETLDDCQSKGGNVGTNGCVKATECDMAKGMVSLGQFNCADGMVCCRKMTG
ncbi:hypothetical protein DRJ25_04855 [Candidatus Woesearchaeota archaeon]|nr:MAG: hypothetical protein DRJ25_04855 [Candidatus Woesearchaeota archaeon]